MIKKWSIGDAKGKFYLDFSFTAKVGDGLDPKAMYQVKFECKVAGAEQVDTGTILGSLKLKEMKPGQVTKLNTIGYGTRNALDTKPEKCSISVGSSSGFGAKKQTADLAAFCWNGKALSAGACK